MTVTSTSTSVELEPGHYTFTSDVDVYWDIGKPAVRKSKGGRYQRANTPERPSRCTLKFDTPTRVHVIAKSEHGTATLEYVRPLEQ